MRAQFMAKDAMEVAGDNLGDEDFVVLFFEPKEL